MGLGAALQQIGGMYLQRNFQRQDDARQQQIDAKRRAEDEALWRDRQAYIARLNPPQERVRQVYDEQRRNALSVRERWDPEAGSWREEGRDVLPPEPGKIQTFRQGDEEVTAMIDPRTGEMRELGRGNAFAPSQRRAGGGRGDGSDGEIGTDGQPKPTGKASDWVIEGGVRVNKLTGEEAPLAKVQQSQRETEEAKARGENAKDIIERATAAKQQLAILDRLDALHKAGASTGPVDKYLGTFSKGAQEYDALVAQLLGPTVKEMFGSTQISDQDRRAAAEALPSRGRYEDVNQSLLAQMRAKATATIQAAEGLKAGGPAGSSPGKSSKSVKRTGTDKRTGRKIVEYTDGTVEYAD